MPYRKVTLNFAGASDSFASIERVNGLERTERMGSKAKEGIEAIRMYLATGIRPDASRWLIVEQREGEGELYSKDPEGYEARPEQWQMEDQTYANGWRKVK